MRSGGTCPNPRRCDPGPAAGHAGGQAGGTRPLLRRRGPRPAYSGTGPWQPLDALLGSAAALGDRSEDVRAALADPGGRDPESVEFRVAASVAQLGLAARLLAPVFGTALITRAAPPADVCQLRWVPAVTSLFRLSLPEAAFTAPPSPDAGTLARDLTRSLLHGLLGALVEAFAAMAVSRRVLWGNVASAINGSAAVVRGLHTQQAESASAASTNSLCPATAAGIGKISRCFTPRAVVTWPVPGSQPASRNASWVCHLLMSGSSPGSVR